MGRPATALLGLRIGCYTVVERVYLPHSDPQHSRSHWRVVCDCGLPKVVCAQNLMRPFPLRCKHVPKGYRVIGPEDVATLEAVKRKV